MMNEILEIVDIGNKILQSPGKQNVVAVAVTKSVKSNVKTLKTDYPDESSVIDAVNESMDVKRDERVGEKRFSSVQSKLIEDFVVTERLPSASSNRRRPREFKPLLVQMVDLLWSELNERFDDKNTSLREAMESLRPSSKTFLNPISWEKLFKYALTVPVIARKLKGKSFKTLHSEWQAFKVPLEEVEWEIDPCTKSIDFIKVANYVVKMFSKGAVIPTRLYKLSVVAGVC